MKIKRLRLALGCQRLGLALILSSGADEQSYLRPLPRLLCLCAAISLPQLLVCSLSLAPLCCEQTALQASGLGLKLYLPGDVFVLVTVFKALICSLFLDLLLLT